MQAHGLCSTSLAVDGLEKFHCKRSVLHYLFGLLDWEEFLCEHRTIRLAFDGREKVLCKLSGSALAQALSSEEFSSTLTGSAVLVWHLGWEEFPCEHRITRLAFGGWEKFFCRPSGSTLYLFGLQAGRSSLASSAVVIWPSGWEKCLCMPAFKLRITALAFGLGEFLLRASYAWKDNFCKLSSFASLVWSLGQKEFSCTHRMSGGSSLVNSRVLHHSIDLRAGSSSLAGIQAPQYSFGFRTGRRSFACSLTCTT